MLSCLPATSYLDLQGWTVCLLSDSSGWKGGLCQKFVEHLEMEQNRRIRSPRLAAIADYGHCFLWAVKQVLNPAVASQRVLPTNRLVLGLLQYFRIWRCLISVDKLHFSLCYAGGTALVLRPAVLCSTELCDIRAQLCLCIHRFWVFRKWF